MVESLSTLVGKQVSVLVHGAKGIAAIKGEFQGQEGDFLIIQLQKGMLGGKARPAFYSKYGIIGIRSEE